MTVNDKPQHPSKAVEISPETQTLVEQTIPHASDEVKQSTMMMIEVIKQQGEHCQATTDDMNA